MASLIVAGLVALAWCGAALRIGPRLGYVDHPGVDSLKVHEKAAVPLGGVGVFLGFHLAALVEDRLDLTLLAATTLVLILGLIDDRRGLPPLLRLLVEVGAGVVVVLGTDGATDSWVTAALGVALVVFAVNAVNLFDGLDGLAGSVGGVAALGAAALVSSRGQVLDDALALAAALAGFLVLAWHPARVFLGDSGAYVLGVLLSGLILRSSDGPAELLIGAGLLGVFALDLVVTVVRRLRNRRPLFLGDRSHVYDQLRDRGMTIQGVVGIAALMQAVLALIVVWVDARSPGFGGVGLLLVVLAGILALLIKAGFLRIDTR